MDHFEYLIIGAGVSGLSFANFIKSDDYCIIEKDAEPGGYCKSIEQDGFTWDYSGHFFHFRDPEIEKFLSGRMAKNAVVHVNKTARIFYNKTYVDFPFQKNIHQLPQKEFLECLHDLFFAKNNKANTFKEMVYANYGNAIATKFLIPYNEKLYACDLDTLDSDAMGRFFPGANMAEIIRHFSNPDNSSYNSFFTYPKKGAIQYINALLKDLDQGKICMNEALLGIDYKNRIATTSRRKIKFQTLVSTIPFPAFLTACKIKYNQNTFSSNKVLAINLGFDKKGNKENHWVYFPDKKLRFYRIGYYDNILNSPRMSVYVEIGMKTSEKVNFKKELETVLRQMEKTGLTNGHKLVSHHHVVMDPAYVHINKDSQKVVKEKTSVLNKNGIYSIGRYGGWKYCSIEDNIIEARDLACNLQKKG